MKFWSWRYVPGVVITGQLDVSRIPRSPRSVRFVTDNVFVDVFRVAGISFQLVL